MKWLEKFHHQISGQGPKLVFLHGLMGSGANWRRITSQLESEYEILVFDQRGHGRSWKPESGYHPEDFAEDLKKILDELGWEKILLVGHSMGGRNAMAFAAKHPEMLQAMVIEDIAPVGSEAGFQRIERLLNLVPTPFGSKKEARQFLLEEFPQKIAGDPQASVLAQYFYTNIVEEEPGRADWRFSKAGILEAARSGRTEGGWQRWQSLDLPLLLVRGANSVELTPGDYQKMLAENPRASGVEIPEAGHWVHFDQVDLFVEALKGFLAKFTRA